MYTSDHEHMVEDKCFQVTHIQKVLDARYGGKFPFEKYRGCAGVMQQYIFYYDLNNNGKG